MSCSCWLGTALDAQASWLGVTARQTTPVEGAPRRVPTITLPWPVRLLSLHKNRSSTEDPLVRPDSFDLARECAKCITLEVRMPVRMISNNQWRDLT